MTWQGGKRFFMSCGALALVIVGSILGYNFLTRFEITITPKAACSFKEDTVSSFQKVLAQTEISKVSPKSFLELAAEAQTTKIKDHKYQCLYEDALAPYRNTKRLKILEIGLGCDVPHGPGASYKIWANYFLDPHITFFDINKPCGEKWLTTLSQNVGKSIGEGGKFKLPKIFYGDQTNQGDLQKMADEDGPWDIIIDDGFHHSSGQIPALKTLFKDVKSGGTYFIEDLVMWSGGPDNSTVIKIAELYILSIYETFGRNLMKDLGQDWSVPGLGQKLDRLTCCSSMCAIRVK